MQSNGTNDDQPELPRKYGFSEWHPRLWHGMTFGAWYSLVRGNFRRIALRRYPLVATITVTAIVNSVIALCLKATYSKAIAATDFERDPVFILGFWRSGTTWLHELMSCDPNHCYPTTLQCIAPEVFPVAEKLRRFIELLMPGKRPMDGVTISMDSPGEDEIAMLNLGCASPYRFIAFPSGGSRELTGYWPKDQAEWDLWGRNWVRFLRHIQFFQPGKRLVLKSPAHTARIGHILQCFPNAKFIHISRNPHALYKSNVKTNKAMIATQSLEVPKSIEGNQESNVVETHSRVYRSFFADADRLRPEQICYLRFEDLRLDPIAEVRRIYDTLGLGTFDDALPKLREFCQKKKNYQPESYELPADATQRLRNEWSEYFRRFGYS